jgi:hypothetical protein
VPPHVQYGIACLLISDAVGSVPYSDEWEFGIVTHPGSHGARGAKVYYSFMLVVTLHYHFILSLAKYQP